MADRISSQGQRDETRTATDGEPPGKGPSSYDVIVVGGGPAGLSAALVLGRCRRSVLVCDEGRPRNAAAHAVHGFLTRDGARPQHLLELAREEIRRYGVEFVARRVVSARRVDCGDHAGARGSFQVTVDGGRTFQSRKVLLATGVVDVLPDIEGARDFYGKGVHHCPYCDGWEHRDGRLAAFGDGEAAVGLALSLRTWSDRVTACTNGRALSAEAGGRLERNGIAARTERVTRLQGDGALRRIDFEGGPPLPCDGFFFNTDKVQRSDLADQLGCEHNDKAEVVTGSRQSSRESGVYVAGDADGDVQFVVVAAAEGATAAVAINRELQDEDRGEA